MELFDTSSSEYLARIWGNKKQTRGANPDGCAALYVRGTGEGLHTTLTRSDGWHRDRTTENTNRLGRYVLNVFSIMTSLARLAKMFDVDPVD